MAENDRTARTQLITPPPEVILTDHTTTAAKRKRSRPAPTSSTSSSSRSGNSMNQDNNSYPQLLETTNPKPRKRGRLHSSQPSYGISTRVPLGHLGPPHRSDDNKQHAPLRRRVTSIPPYERPRDVFTPPRVVFNSMNNSSKRKTPTSASGSKSTKGKKKGSTLTILTSVKQEMPDIDLSLPMPPPSPSDDPLLLLGPLKPEPTDESIMQPGPSDAGISPVRLFDQRWEEKKVEVEEWEDCQMSVDLENSEEPTGPLNNLVPLQGGDNDQNGDDDDELRLVKITSEDPRVAAKEALIQEEEVRQLSVDLDDEKPSSPFDNPVPFKGENDNRSDDDGDNSSLVRITSVDPHAAGRAAAIKEEDREVCQVPVVLDNEEPASPFDNLVSLQGKDDDQSSDDGDDLKITSADPRATVSAAVILNQAPWPIYDEQRDYDCYANTEVKRRHLVVKHRRNLHSGIEDFAKDSRRRNVSSSGVAKASISIPRHRSTLYVSMIGDTVCIPGGLATTMPELLQEAEHERSLVLAGRVDLFKPPVAKYGAQIATAWMADRKFEVYGSASGWEWRKHFDACFMDQRLELGSRLAGTEQDLLAPVDIISIDNVVDKFVASEGEFDTVASFGGLWSRQNLFERTCALQKKQLLEYISAPTTLYAPSSVEEQDGLPQLESGNMSSDAPSTTIGKRVKSFLFSYLPTLPKSSSVARKAPTPLQPSLPIPPADILSKLRGPVITPARAPLSKPKHPKELVVLHRAPQPLKISLITRTVKPRRLVELRPSAQLPIVEPTPIPRPRRSSGNSVKDLVRGFEELRTLTHYQPILRMKGNEGSKEYADRKPRWKA